MLLVYGEEGRVMFYEFGDVGWARLDGVWLRIWDFISDVVRICWRVGR